MNHPLLKAAILTAISVEYESVREYLTDVKDYENTLYRYGLFNTDDSCWEVMIHKTGKYNTKSALETNRVIELFKPDIAIFVGIAGGIKDVEIGDVVAASSVHGYEMGKEKDIFYPRTEVHRSNKFLLEIAERISDDHNREVYSPRYLVQPIAVGEKVVASTESVSYEVISTHLSHCVAVEMEGYGFLEAAYQYPEIPVIVIRGISDLLNNKTESDAEGKQESASMNAADFAYQILKLYPKYMKKTDHYKDRIDSKPINSTTSEAKSLKELGMLEYNKKNFNKAEEYFHKLLEINTYDYHIHFLISCCAAEQYSNEDFKLSQLIETYQFIIKNYPSVQKDSIINEIVEYYIFHCDRCYSTLIEKYPYGVDQKYIGSYIIKIKEIISFYEFIFTIHSNNKYIPKQICFICDDIIKGIKGKGNRYNVNGELIKNWRYNLPEEEYNIFLRVYNQYK